MPEPSITPEMILNAYCQGAFPMAESRHGTIAWYTADPRGVIPLEPDRFHIPRSLAKLVRRKPFDITFDRAFADVVTQCAARDETWINDEIIGLYTELHRMGFGHSIEAWRNGQLVGGIYGLSINAGFFGESMFSRESGASKVCLVHLVEYLRGHGYTLFDAQFSNPHLEQFGLVEVAAPAYMQMLDEAINNPTARAWGETL